MRFRVGQKVVCVDASPCSYSGRSVLRLGDVYTVRGLDPEAEGAIYLHEVPDDPPHWRWGYPIGWRATRFRPAVECSTESGMAILRQIAAHHKTPERVG